MAMDQLAAAARLGQLLQTVFTKGIIYMNSEDYRDFDMVTKLKTTDEAAKSVSFMLQSALGMPAIQFVKQGQGAKFPASKAGSSAEFEAGFNNMMSTIELDYDLWQRALGTPAKYAEPLIFEINNKSIGQKRLLSAAFHLDGTGAVGKLSASVAGAIVNTDEIKLTFASGGERYMEWEDEFYLAAADTTIVDWTNANNASGSAKEPVALKVVDKDRENNTVTCVLIDADGDELVATNTQAAECAVDLYVYRGRQSAAAVTAGTTPVNQSTIVSGGAEVNNMSEAIMGLESLTAVDGRVVNGITMRGVYGGTRSSASSQALDISHLQKGLDKVKTRVGQGRYKYKQLLSSPEALTALIESQEADRRLININDNKRGQKGFGYIHGSDTLEVATTEFVASDRIWAIPEGSAKQGVLEMHGKDFQEVKVGGVSEFLKSGSSGYEPAVQKFMLGYMLTLSRHPAAILAITDFTV